MYRTVALAFLREEAPPTAEEAARLLPNVTVDIVYQGGEMQVLLNGEPVSSAIREPHVGQMASRVGTLAAVREKMVAEQQRIGRAFRDDPGVVIDGRDIGTVVFPDADLKIFMVADASVRARRRQAELAEQGKDVPFEDVLAEIQQRDKQDTERAHSPLKRADDAIDLDTTECSLDDQIQFVLNRAGERP
jgi:cytidylate kinase